MKKTFSNIFFNTTYQIFLVIVPIITAPYLSRVLGPDNMGKYSFVETMITLFTTVGLIGLYDYGTREIAYVRDKSKRERSKIFFEITLIRLILLVVSLSIYWIYISHSPYRFYFICAMVWLIANFLDPTWFFNGMEEFKLITIKNFIIKITTIVLIFLMVKNQNDLYKYFFIIGIGQVINIILLVPNLKKHIGFYKFRCFNIARHIKPTIKVFLPQIAALVYTQVDKVMIEALTPNIANVTFYDNAEKIVKVPLAVITSINLVLMPNNANLFINGKIEEVKQIINKTIQVVLLITLPMAFGLASIGFTLVPWYLGVEFTEAGYIIVWLVPIIIALALSGISANQYFIAINKTNYLTKSYIYAAILNVIVNYIFIPRIGCYGAALGTVVAETVSVGVQYYYMSKDIKIIDSFKSVIKYIIASLIMCVVSVFIGCILGAKVTTTLLQIIVSVLIYCIFLILSKDRLVFDFISQLKNKSVKDLL